MSKTTKERAWDLLYALVTGSGNAHETLCAIANGHYMAEAMGAAEAFERAAEERWPTPDDGDDEQGDDDHSDIPETPDEELSPNMRSAKNLLKRYYLGEGVSGVAIAGTTKAPGRDCLVDLTPDNLESGIVEPHRIETAALIALEKNGSATVRHDGSMWRLVKDPI